MSIFLKFSTCRMIIAQTTYFANIQYFKIYFYYGLSLAKTSYNDTASFYWKIFSFQISIFFKKVHFSQIFKLPHNYRPNYLFENIQCCKIYSHYGIGLAKTSYNDSASFFRFRFFFKFPFFSNFQIAA